MTTETLTALEKKRMLKAAEEEKRPKNFGDVFSAEGKLDNAVLESSLSMIPSPTGWRIAVLPYRGAQLTKGGIALTRETQDKAAIATTCAYVLKVGPLAYRDESKFPTGPGARRGIGSSSAGMPERESISMAERSGS